MGFSLYSDDPYAGETEAESIYTAIHYDFTYPLIVDGVHITEFEGRCEVTCKGGVWTVSDIMLEGIECKPDVISTRDYRYVRCPEFIAADIKQYLENDSREKDLIWEALTADLD